MLEPLLGPPPSAKLVLELVIDLGADADAALRVLDLCPSVRHLAIESAQLMPALSPGHRLHSNLTRLDIRLSSSEPPTRTVFAFLQTLPALKHLVCSASVIPGHPAVVDDSDTLALPLFTLQHYSMDALFGGCALPIIASQSSLRTLELSAWLSPAFLIPGAVNGDYASAGNMALAAEARRVFEATLTVAPQLREFYLRAQRRSQSPDNPEQSSLRHLLPLFSAFRALRVLFLILQLDADAERDELCAALAAVAAPLDILRMFFMSPLITQVRPVTAFAGDLYGFPCLQRLRVLHVLMSYMGNDIAVTDAVGHTLGVFHEFCRARRIRFMSRRVVW